MDKQFAEEQEEFESEVKRLREEKVNVCCLIHAQVKQLK